MLKWVGAVRFSGVNSNIAVIQLGRPIEGSFAVVQPPPPSGGAEWRIESSTEGWRVVREGVEIFWFSVNEETRPITFRQKLELGESGL
ncbi:hypothetical protein B9Q09_06070 [Candidatus Marsarchaeota G2 archaeon ECH_B_SAG-C16]|uniref:Uncharacterized protein n=1 Tax=Candidatus Marsarchaeota G2 archaeon ECH_B_SAG-C16 TaxID=1978163 RepID=A0A2R6B492_9ARCH|nr:MAG: hypothetical protein B9Q09_06070 [Candidatus Marsarchaeota G2 archaeon ECH_B_SAG-C16]